ncbi:MAG TPA: hypothetical protein VH158_01325 [Gemmatimonadales bacterium]|jgi:hypothetical protein|nr:hypothetical protein [Gemmatimonadales bacterium]
MADIRPMNFGEILDGALMIYRRHFGLFLKLAVAALSLPVVLSAYFVVRAFSDLMTNPLRALVYLLPLGLLYYIASLVLTAGTIRIISDSYLGRTPQLRDALALGISKIVPLIAVGLGKGIVLALIIMACALVAGIGGAVLRGSALGVALIVALVIGGVWFTVFVASGYGVTTPVVVLEDLGSSFDALGRSWELTRGFKLKVLGLAVVAFLLCNLLPSQVLQGIGTVVMRTTPAAGIGLTVAGVVLPLILAPVIAAVITLMYYDLRVRREAFDLQVLGRHLGII